MCPVLGVFEPALRIFAGRFSKSERGERLLAAVVKGVLPGLTDLDCLKRDQLQQEY